jgi:nitroreductase
MPDEFFRIVHSRKSVRHYTGEPVDKTRIETLLKAAMAAPSARNEQPWAFLVITREETLASLARGLTHAKMLPEAGCGIVVCAEIHGTPPPGRKDLWPQDCAAATQNILLAAEAMKLGAVWTAVYPYPDRESHVRKILDLPENCIPFCVIPVGYPTGADMPKDKFNSSKIHWDRW